jgi:hypothetical protein
MDEASHGSSYLEFNPINFNPVTNTKTRHTTQSLEFKKPEYHDKFNMSYTKLNEKKNIEKTKIFNKSIRSNSTFEKLIIKSQVKKNEIKDRYNSKKSANEDGDGGIVQLPQNHRLEPCDCPPESSPYLESFHPTFEIRPLCTFYEFEGINLFASKPRMKRKNRKKFDNELSRSIDNTIEKGLSPEMGYEVMTISRSRTPVPKRRKTPINKNLSLNIEDESLLFNNKSNNQEPEVCCVNSCNDCLIF